MSNRELPMMPWFPKEFAAATWTWSFAERSAYRALLDVQWEVGVLPDETWRLAQAIGMPLDEFERVWPVVRTKFDPVEGGIRNLRLEEHRLKASRKKKAHQAGADIVNAQRRANRDAQRRANRDAQRRANRDAQRPGSDAPPSPSPSPSEEITPQPPAQRGAVDNSKRRNGANPRALGTNPRTVEEQQAQRTKWAGLLERARRCGFRLPYEADSLETYETALRIYERDASAREGKPPETTQ